MSGDRAVAGSTGGMAVVLEVGSRPGVSEGGSEGNGGGIGGGDRGSEGEGGRV